MLANAGGRLGTGDLAPGRLGDPTNLPAWAIAARALLALDGVTATSLARAADIAVPTVHQRIRRHPG